MKDSLLDDIEDCLLCGELIPWDGADDFVDGLRGVKKRVDGLVKKGEAKRAIKLYEVFLSGCEEKMDEMSDEGIEMGEFFREMFVSWIRARQSAQCDAQETVHQMLRMIDQDDYGLCEDIEKEIVEHIKGDEAALFIEKIRERFEKALTISTSKEPKSIHDFSWDVRKNADILKEIALVKRNIRMYCDICERTGFIPKDYEAIAGIYMGRRRWEDALQNVERGLELEKTCASGPDYSGYNLAKMRREILKKTGHDDEAFQAAWEDFKKSPGEYGYKDLMKYVPSSEKEHWHQMAMEHSQQSSLSEFISLCLETGEISRLAEEILRVTDSSLEDIFYGNMQEAANNLITHFPLVAAKAYRALGMSILNRKKSKCYGYAIDYFRKVRDLYSQSGEEREWLSLVKVISANHSQKSAFMPDFNVLIKGGDPGKGSSFETRAQERWKKKIA